MLSGRAGHWRELFRRYLFSRPAEPRAACSARPRSRSPRLARVAVGWAGGGGGEAGGGGAGRADERCRLRAAAPGVAVRAGAARRGPRRSPTRCCGRAPRPGPTRRAPAICRAARRGTTCTPRRCGSARPRTSSATLTCTAASEWRSTRRCWAPRCSRSARPAPARRGTSCGRSSSRSACRRSPGTAAVVAVGAAGADLGPAEAFDVVITIGDPASPYDLDLYGGAADADEAAGLLAVAVLDGFEGEQADPRRAATALAQLLGPYRAAHGRFPAVTELRELLDGSPAAVAGLRERLDERGGARLGARTRRQEPAVGPPGGHRRAARRPDRAARPARLRRLLRRHRAHPAVRPHSLEHPLRVRIDLPERGHAEAARILSRLLLAQFAAAATARKDRSLFACLVLDDATHAVTVETVRALQRLRSAHAGAVLTLRGLDDVPEVLRGRAAGCGRLPDRVVGHLDVGRQAVRGGVGHRVGRGGGRDPHPGPVRRPGPALHAGRAAGSSPARRRPRSR